MYQKYPWRIPCLAIVVQGHNMLRKGCRLANIRCEVEVFQDDLVWDDHGFSASKLKKKTNHITKARSHKCSIICQADATFLPWLHLKSIPHGVSLNSKGARGPTSCTGPRCWVSCVLRRFPTSPGKSLHHGKCWGSHWSKRTSNNSDSLRSARCLFLFAACVIFHRFFIDVSCYF